ncbi:MAG: hypothetical protein GXP38_11375 [Chloroflexi bacterium]|nr:hypothetical protein [Chloroflexota bacterium]
MSKHHHPRTSQHDHVVAATMVPAPPLPDWMRRVTMEQLAYAVLLLVPLIIRLIDLGARPLAPTEASTALRAWQASQGHAPNLDAGIPVLFTLDTLTFWLIGASDGLARIWPLIASSALILVLLDWRRWLGRVPTLLTATLLTFSPLLNAFARRNDGVSFALLAAALMVAGWARVQNEDRRGWGLLAAGVGLSLISGPTGFSGLLALLVLILFSLRKGHNLPSWPGISHLAIAVIVLLVGGTAFFMYIDALGLAAVNLTTWLQSWTLRPGAVLWAAIHLLVDEPLIVPLGLAGLIVGLRRRSTSSFLHPAAWLLLIVALLQGPDAAGSRALLTLFLAPLAAQFILDFRREGDFSWDEAEPVLYGIVFEILLALSVFSLITYSWSGEKSQLSLLAGALVMSVVVSAVFILFIGWRRVLSVGALAIILSLAIYNFAEISAIGFDRAAPRYATLYAQDTRIALRDLRQTAGDISERQRGDRWALSIAILSDVPGADLLQWELRQSPYVQVVDSISLENAPPLVIAPTGRELNLSERYAGEPFRILDTWTPTQSDIRQKIAWLIFRTAPWDRPTTDVVLWVDGQFLIPPESKQ